MCQTLLNTTLAYYDWSKPIIVQTDASKYSLSAALIQCGRPIAFASKTLMDVETHYANIERECLSLCFGLDKFHTYLHGRHVMVENDNKPLEMIKHKPIHAAPPRLQCMLLHMQKYHYIIQYKPSKDMILADSDLLKSPTLLLSSMCSCPPKRWMLPEELSSMNWSTVPCTGSPSGDGLTTSG